MISHDSIRFLAEGSVVRTEGLSLSGRREIKVDAIDHTLSVQAENFLRAVVGYVRDTKTALKPEETFAYGYWLTLFRAPDNNTLEVWEYAADASHFVAGARLTLTYWRDQHIVCAKYKAEFMPPRPDKLAVISAGVLEGDPMQGVRYPSPDHMSGWWITTDRYDGNVKSLRTEHLHHVRGARADLARYIALPYGFRFDLSSGEDVWFDEMVAGQPAR